MQYQCSPTRKCDEKKENCQSNHNGRLEVRKIPLRANENSKVKTNKLPKARENADDQVMMGFSFASDWLRKGHEFFGPITERKTIQSRITFDTQLKIALTRSSF